MTEYISIETIENAINERIKHLIEEGQEGCDELREVLFFAKEQSISEFLISLENELPPLNEIVQVWCNGLKNGKRVDVGGTTLWHYDGEPRYTYEAPTHWQPLPEPPKLLNL